MSVAILLNHKKRESGTNYYYNRGVFGNGLTTFVRQSTGSGSLTLNADNMHMTTASRSGSYFTGDVKVDVTNVNTIRFVWRCSTRAFDALRLGVSDNLTDWNYAGGTYRAYTTVAVGDYTTDIDVSNITGLKNIVISHSTWVNAADMYVYEIESV